jgi:hypothetical protein
MSFDHKAFAFEWAPFQLEMAGVLGQALRTGDASRLERFIDANLAVCASPYDGEKLESGWRRTLPVAGLQEIADFALTKYYDPSDDHGLHEEWSEIEGGLSEACRIALLGTPFREGEHAVFDPGLMGSYFQSPEQVRASLSTLSAIDAKDLEDYVRFLRTVVREAKGLYVTF